MLTCYQQMSASHRFQTCQYPFVPTVDDTQSRGGRSPSVHFSDVTHIEQGTARAQDDPRQEHQLNGPGVAHWMMECSRRSGSPVGRLRDNASRQIWSCPVGQHPTSVDHDPCSRARWPVVCRQPSPIIDIRQSDGTRQRREVGGCGSSPGNESRDVEPSSCISGKQRVQVADALNKQRGLSNRLPG